MATLAEIKEAAALKAVEDKLKEHDGNVAQAAADLSIPRLTIYRILGRHQVKVEGFRKEVMK
jgi:transcriptional regulator of acetoin/glycerol metabolism